MQSTVGDKGRQSDAAAVLIKCMVAGGRPHPRLRCLMSSIPKEVMDKFYGCGAPLPLGIDNLRVRTT